MDDACAVQITKELDLGRAMARSYALRQRMLHFVQNLIYYITVEVRTHARTHATRWKRPDLVDLLNC